MQIAHLTSRGRSGTSSPQEQAPNTRGGAQERVARGGALAAGDRDATQFHVEPDLEVYHWPQAHVWTVEAVSSLWA